MSCHEVVTLTTENLTRKRIRSECISLSNLSRPSQDLFNFGRPGVQIDLHFKFPEALKRNRLHFTSRIDARFLFLFVFSLIRPNLFAQEDNFLLWMNYAVKVPVNEKISWGGDVGVRGLGTTLDLSQLLIRPAVTYELKESASISGAVAWFGTYNRGTYALSELRFHQDLNATWPYLKSVHFFYRLRVEERFFFCTSDIPNAFRVRLRALMGVQTKDLTWLGTKRPIYFQSMLEGFKTIDRVEALEVFINQARFYAAFGHKISERFRYEIHYIHQGSTLFTSDGIETTQNIIRLRLLHNL